MVTSGIVREWHDEQGWGVIDSSDTPGGCWAHFSSIEMAGYRSVRAGQVVTPDFEAAEQDGYSFRASHVGVGDGPPWALSHEGSSGGAHVSTLTIRYDDPTDPDDG